MVRHSFNNKFIDHVYRSHCIRQYYKTIWETLVGQFFPVNTFFMHPRSKFIMHKSNRFKFKGTSKIQIYKWISQIASNLKGRLGGLKDSLLKYSNNGMMVILDTKKNSSKPFQKVESPLNIGEGLFPSGGIISMWT